VHCGGGHAWRPRAAAKAASSGASAYNHRMARKNENERDHGLLVETSRPEVAPPPLYQVLLLNDDYTPMDFVVTVLQQFFAMDLEKATQVMLHVHTRGRGVCGVYSREVAESKVAQVNEFSRMNQHPLLCTMEKS
jgi:ATP-dependent Clp protease adaptor protein ClpS